MEVGVCPGTCNYFPNLFTKRPLTRISKPAPGVHGMRGLVGDHQPYTTTTKDFRSKRGILEGLVYELSKPKRRAKYTPPPGLHWRCSSWILWGWCVDCGVRLGEGLAEKVGNGLAKGWRRVDTGLAECWRRVGRGWRVSLHPPILQFPKRPFRRKQHGFGQARFYLKQLWNNKGQKGNHFRSNGTIGAKIVTLQNGIVSTERYCFELITPIM